MYLRKKIDRLPLHKEEILSFITEDDFYKGARLSSFNVFLYESNPLIINKEDAKKYYFRVRDSYSYRMNYTEIIIKDNRIYDCKCDCFDYQKNNSCYHIGAAFYNYADDLFDDVLDDSSLYKEIINKYIDNNHSKIKKELKLQINFLVNNELIENAFFNNGYFVENELKVTIGYNKMYSLFNKFPSFYYVFENEEGKCDFGKELSYNTNEYYFTKENINLIKMLHSYYDNSNRNLHDSLTKIIDYLINNNIKFSVNNHLISNFYEGSPLVSYVKKIGENYEITFNYKDLLLLDKYANYVYYKGDVYVLSNKESNLLLDICDNSIDKLNVNKNEFETFSNGLLKIIKNKAEIDESAKEDLVINLLTDTELYIDISKEIIKLKLLFDYKGTKINYFDKNSKVVRDEDEELKCLQDILSYGFIIDKETFILEGLDNQVNFIENDLNKLSEKYKVFTSEKFKKINIKRNTNVSSVFSIGGDNILSYGFNLDGINNDELVNVFKEIKNKKKYYRLKNGDILNLEDENLKELEDLADELDFTDEEIINGKGEIQKYRAIYLDSLTNRYKHLETNNLFKDFITNFYKYKDSKLTISKKEMNILRDYQVTGVKWLYNIHNTGFGGILADEMGLGKTIQSIYYIKQILKDDKNAKFLIVVPTSLVYNWEHEFDLYGNEISKTIISGNKNEREKLVNNNTSVYITSYGLLREDENLYENKSFHTMFIDEAQSIKNFAAGITKVTKKIKSETKFALTGTPIENSPLELWSIFDFIMPGYLSNIVKFRNKYRIKDFDEDTNILIKGLNKQISPFILRRKKIDVTKELPEKIENNIFVDLDDEQKKLYVAELDKVKKKIEEIKSSNDNKRISFLILPLLSKLRQICIDPRIVYENYNKTSNKIETLKMVLKENILNGNKILIFTSFRGAMNILCDELKEENIPYYIINGEVSSAERLKRVNEFNESSKPAVFIIMLKSGGTGLNLASASVVIHLDLWWNPQAENQATDRAHRIGQTKSVEVIHLITKGTIEEKILELQHKKLELSNKLIDGESRDKDIISSLSEEDIKNLLAFENKD